MFHVIPLSLSLSHPAHLANEAKKINNFRIVWIGSKHFHNRLKTLKKRQNMSDKTFASQIMTHLTVSGQTKGFRNSLEDQTNIQSTFLNNCSRI